MNRIEIAPEGELAIGTFTDDEGVTYVAIDLGGDDTALRLYYRIDHFVRVADHLRSVADAIVQAKTGNGPYPSRGT